MAQKEFLMSDEDKANTFMVIPAYNEEGRVQPVIESIAERGFKMVVVNDGSTDKTLEKLIESQKKYPNNIFILNHVINQGMGAAIGTGIDAVLKHNPKYIVNLDADGQHDIDDIDKVCEPLIKGRADAVIGVRPFEDMPITKNFANTVMNILTRVFYGVNVSDSQTGFRAVTAEALEKIEMNVQGYIVASEFLRQFKENNIKLEEVTITTIYTPETQEKGTNAIVGLKIMFNMIKHLLFE
ncbi:MAG: glycosyltransferase family 2 protein [Methanobrevibacter sp.]|uniref:glycosyltransferase family 2 protein n=1 Tax=Methanobrevibacter sp. TaxID=66852 RepID=UPI0026E04379|nr:glycosyltransferase family 2 protein [Methanobrevibacter sp.]MDO5849367.1 glycosyltransferase family 2 protein [Methanobrevibacter sp.]